MLSKAALIYSSYLFLIINIASAQVSRQADSLLNLLNEAQEDTGKVQLLYQLGVIYSTTDTAKSFSYARQAIALAGKLRHRPGIAKGYLVIGDGYYYTQNYKPALENLTKGLQIAREINDKRLESNALHDMGIVYTGWGAYAIALKYMLRALKLNEAAGYQAGIHAVTANLAYLYGSARNYPLNTSINPSKSARSGGWRRPSWELLVI